MKLNNLSRLTALLIAVMLCSIPCASASGIDWSDLTGTTLDAVDLAAEMVSEENRCSICANELTTRGYTEWPVENFDCFHTYLASMTVEEAYQMLYELDMSDDFALAQVYINAHANHVTQATGDQKKEAVICYNFDCSKNTFDTPPGPSHIQGTCPWYQETLYVPTTPVTTEPDVSTPDVLAGVTEVVLTFTTTSTEGTVLTYTWQRSADPDAETPVWEAVATGSTYTLPVDAAALAYAYRCEVTDASGNVVSTSSTLYLGGKEFFAWVSSTEGESTVAIRDWLLLEGNKVEYVLAAYAAYLKGIALSEAIHVTTITETVDSTTVTSTVLLELLNLSTLAEIDAAGNVIDVRYHIAVATYKDGVITALPTDDTTATN